MLQRGRKSVASLTVVPTPLPGRRYAPPKTLSDVEAKVWKSVVATKPADWFSEDSHPLLVAYCRSTVMADKIAVELDSLEATVAAATLGGDGMAGLTALTLTVKMRKELLAQRNAEVDKLVSLARSMRLSQQARYRGETATNKAKAANGTTGAVKKPWE